MSQDARARALKACQEVLVTLERKDQVLVVAGLRAWCQTASFGDARPEIRDDGILRPARARRRGSAE